MTNRIKQLRKENGLTLKELSREVGIPASTISQYENERRKIPASALKTLSTFFEVPENYILGAWSKKEVLELMSSSLKANYNRIYKMAIEYGGDGEEWRLLDEISIDGGDQIYITGRGQVMKFNESAPNTISSTPSKKKFIDELRRNYFEGLAFAVLKFVYYRGVCHNFHTEEHFDYEARIEADDKLTDAEKKIRLNYKSYPEIKGHENVHRFMMNFWRKRNSEKRLAFLDAFFHEYDDNSILEDAVVNKIMQEKVPAETMALVLTSVINSATNSFGIAVRSENELYIISRLEQQYKELSNEFDELQKENDRLKAELASKR